MSVKNHTLNPERL